MRLGLRHSFAVLRLTLWYRQQASLGNLLPALATYLGHAIASSQRYLQLTEDVAADLTHRYATRWAPCLRRRASVTTHDLAPFVTTFFTRHLPAERNASPHTIAAYRDTLKLLLRFLAASQHRTASALHVEDLTPERTLAFLEDLETTRRNTIRTRNRNGQRLTRHGARYLLDKYVQRAQVSLPSLARTRISPHTFRHTKAMHLLQSDIPLVTVKDFLGHADVKSTEVYVQSDLAMKRDALDRVGTPIRIGPKPRRLSKDLLDWLESL